MNIKYIVYLFFGILLPYWFISCDSGSSSYTYESESKDAQIYSFSFTGSPDTTAQKGDDKLFEIVNKTKFAINQVSDIIYNPDSMPYGTVLRNKVLPSLSFNPTYGAGAVEITIPDSLSGFYWNKTDSVDFSKQPISFKVTSADGSNTKIYTIDIRIHRIDPDTITWQKMTSYPAAIGDSKTLLTDKNQFYTYSVRNNSISLYTTNKSAIDWESKPLSGLITADVLPESILLMNSVFYAIDSNGSTYKSNDGESWAKIENGKKLTSIIGIMPGVTRSDDALLVAIEDDGKYYFGKTKDMASVETVTNLNGSSTNYEIPLNFPHRQSSALPSYSSDKNFRMLLLSGGIDKSGSDVSYTWIVRNVSEGLEVSPFTKNSLYKGAGLSNFFYDDKVYVLADNQFYISETWGDLWYAAPNKQMPDPDMQIRSGQSLIVDAENNIWIFGGISENGTYLNDVWKGRLNKLIPSK